MKCCHPAKSEVEFLVIKLGSEIIARPDFEVVKKSASKIKENKGFSITEEYPNSQSQN